MNFFVLQKRNHNRFHEDKKNIRRKVLIHTLKWSYELEKAMHNTSKNVKWQNEISEMVIKNPSSTLQILNVKVQFSEFNVSERLKDSVKLRRKKVSACFKKIKNQKSNS